MLHKLDREGSFCGETASFAGTHKELLVTGPVYLSGDRARSGLSDDTGKRVDAEVTRMLREAYSRVTSLLVQLFLSSSLLQASVIVCAAWFFVVLVHNALQELLLAAPCHAMLTAALLKFSSHVAHDETF